MSAWLAKIAALFSVELVQRLLSPLIAWIQKKIAEAAKKKEQEAETAAVLKKVQDAQTEEERIQAARSSAGNSTGE